MAYSRGTWHMAAPVWLAILAVSALAAAAEAPKAAPAPLPPIEKATWIWCAGDDGNQTDFICYFRKAFTLDDVPATADVLVTADNAYELYVNGSLVGGDSEWKIVGRYDIKHLLARGANVIAVRGINVGGPGGLLVAARIELKTGPLEIVTDATWRTTLKEDAQFTQAEYNDSAWAAPIVLGKMGVAPWGKLAWTPDPAAQAASGFREAPAGFAWPAGVVFLRGRVPMSSTPGAPQAVWRIGATRAYLEMDTLGPAMFGRSLWTLTPARPGGKPVLRVDAGRGSLGSPSVSHDGKEIYFSMAPAGEAFLHIYRLAAAGGPPQAVTSGPWHDFDPEPLGDGRIVFSSTRIGSREEYHGNPGRSLFIMNADGTGIRPVTSHIVGDNEPRVTADGRIAFIRCDNFFERAKVETQIHVVRPDGTAGEVLLGPNRRAIGYDRATAAENDAAWLRTYGFGSPAPLPDGRVACISSMGVVVSGAGSPETFQLRPSVPPVDIAPLPDGRLLFTALGGGALGVMDITSGECVAIHRAPIADMHSVAYLGTRPRPPVLHSTVPPEAADDPAATGFLLCLNVFNTRQDQADLARIKAVRIIQGTPFTNRSGYHPYDHIGVDGTELGTVPLAGDGSFYVEVPADRALTIQAIDGEGRSVINEASWIYVRPGEQRSCVGCHGSRDAAPAGVQTVQALRAPPVKLVGQGTPHRFRANNAANGGVLNLQYDRFREAATINLYPPGVSAAGQDPAALPPARPATVQALAQDLTRGDAGAKVSAAQRLAIFRDRSAAPALAAALKDADPQVRMNAALALAACGTRESVGPLLAALDDTSLAAAQAAGVALGNLTGHDEPFNAYDDAEKRTEGAKAWRAWVAANAFEKIEQTLAGQLASAKPVEVMRAVAALGHIGGPAGKAALRAYVAADKGADLRAMLEALRGLGHLQDAEAVGVLRGVLEANLPKIPQKPKGNPEFGSLQRPVHLAGCAAEALGRIDTPDARAALVQAVPQLVEFWHYTTTSGDHSWLMGCHSSVPHYRIMEALDALSAAETAPLVPVFLKSVPIDTDRGLLFENDGYEVMAGRVVNRSGLAPRVIETCLAVLGDEKAQPDAGLKDAVTASPPASSVGPLCAESRAAQTLSVVCLSPEYAPRIAAALDRYRATPPSRTRSWTCFFLARTLGKLRAPAAVDSLMACLTQDATEASLGRIEPPNVFLFKAMTPYYRAAAGYALGEIGDRRAAPALLKVVADMDNAMDVRHAAARGLAMLRDPATQADLKKLAADYPEVATRRVLLAACQAVPPATAAAR